MTLSKQLVLLICALVILLFAGSFAISCSRWIFTARLSFCFCMQVRKNSNQTPRSSSPRSNVPCAYTATSWLRFPATPFWTLRQSGPFGPLLPYRLLWGSPLWGRFCDRLALLGPTL